MALDASTLPALNVLSHHVLRIDRLPASTPAAAVAGPTAGGSSNAASESDAAHDAAAACRSRPKYARPVWIEAGRAVSMRLTIT